MFNKDLKESVKKILQSLLPELTEQLAFPIKAKVLKVYTESNKYKCDVLPLRNNLEEIEVSNKFYSVKKSLQVIKEVEINSIANGDVRGFFALPEKDSIVRVSFYNGDFNFPFVDAVLSSKTPALEDGEVSIYRDKDTYITLKKDKTININSTQKVTVKTTSEIEINGNETNLIASKVNLSGKDGKGVVCVGMKCNFGGTHAVGSTKVKAE